MIERILVTPRSLSNGNHPGLTPLTDAGFELCFPTPGRMPDEADLMAAVPGCIGWLAGVEPVSENVIKAADSLRIISRNGTGIDNLPLKLVEDRQITIKRAVGTNARGVAELALGLTLAGLRHIVRTSNGMAKGDWPRYLGREMKGAEVAVIGLGTIGQKYARFIAALGASVRGYDPFAAPLEGIGPAFKRLDLHQALDGADIVSLHAPMTEDGRPILDAGALAQLRPGAVVVNTARAGLVDEHALLDALNAGTLWCYAADVFDQEPPAPSPLLRHPNVIQTSHIGGYTKESVDRTTSRAVGNLLHVLRPNAV